MHARSAPLVGPERAEGMCTRADVVCTYLTVLAVETLPTLALAEVTARAPVLTLAQTQ